MLRVVQRELGKRLPAASFHATVSHSEAPFAYRSGIVPGFYAPDLRMQLLRTIPFVPRILDLLISMRNPDFARALKTNSKAAYEIKAIAPVDAVVDVSGFAYSDSWGTESFKNAWPWLEYCQLKHKPYIFLPQAWGPFETEAVALLAKKLCSAAGMLVSRDEESSRHLARLQELPITKVRQAPDIAFRFQGAPDTAGSLILKNLGIKGDRPVIGLVPNMQVYNRTDGASGTNLYIKLLVSLVDHCSKQFNADVLLVPNEIRVPGSKWPDDRYLCGIIAARVQDPEHCFTLRSYVSSEVVKAILGQLDLLVASRFHSLVFALSQGVPVIALGWSHKYYELLLPFGMEEYIVNHDNLDAHAVISIVEKVWEKRTDTGTCIRNTIPRLQDQVGILFDEVAAMLLKESF